MTSSRNDPQAKMGPSETNARLISLIETDAPAFVGRMGEVESRICSWCLGFSRRVLDRPPSEARVAKARNNAGIPVHDTQALDRFSSIYLSSLANIDVVGVWPVKGMDRLLQQFANPAVVRAPLAALEPWVHLAAGERPWTLALEGKTVLVVHPFERSILAQWARREDVLSAVMPRCDLKTVLPPVTFAGQATDLRWEQHLDQLKRNIAAQSFDVALLGCGAYGLPAGAFVKSLGKTAIHLGGGTQLLFGIRGRRWETGFPVSRFMDENWVSPAEEERPQGAAKVEAGCYW